MSPDPVSPSPVRWMPGPWLRSTSQGLVWVAAFFVVMQVFPLLRPLVRGLGSPALVSMALLLGLLAVIVVVHELGHYLAARWQGMGVVAVRLGPLVLLPQRGRWRMRWETAGGWMSGGVSAFAVPGRPFRRQQWRFILGGSLANLALAAVAAGLAAAAWDAPAARLLLALAVLNVLVGLANWLPLSADSDGTQLCRLWRGLDLGQPGMEGYELNQRALAGETADELPEALLQGLEKESPAMALWFRIFAALNRRDLAGLRELEARLDAWEAQLERPAREAWAVFTSFLRAELHFARAIGDGTPLPDPDPRWLSHAPRARPGTCERHEALAHALAGRAEARDDALARAERECGFNPDAAARRSEARMRDWVRSLPLPAPGA